MYYSFPIQFIETAVFTERVMELGLEADPRPLQLLLSEEPRRGAVEPGLSGLRKIRMGDSARGIGKRGGARVHYLFLPERLLIIFLFVYRKTEQDTLSPWQRRRLNDLVLELKREWGDLGTGI